MNFFSMIWLFKTSKQLKSFSSPSCFCPPILPVFFGPLLFLYFLPLDRFCTFLTPFLCFWPLPICCFFFFFVSYLSVCLLDPPMFFLSPPSVCLFVPILCLLHSFFLNKQSFWSEWKKFILKNQILHSNLQEKKILYLIDNIRDRSQGIFFLLPFLVFHERNLPLSMIK